MESTGATFFFARSAFPPTAVTAVKDARLLLASGGRWRRPSVLPVVAAALDKGPGASGNGGKKTGGGGVPNSNYVVPLDLTPSFIRPLKEILRDLNKRVPDNIINAADNSVPWYHANRMLSFYAPGYSTKILFTNQPTGKSVTGALRENPSFLDSSLPSIIYNLIFDSQFLAAFASQGWCGEVRAIEFSDNHVTVVYRVTVRGLDGEIHRESTATVSLNDGRFEDPLAAAEELAFCKACARFGFGLHLYHEETPKNI